MSAQEHRGINKCLKQMLKVCDDMDRILDRMVEDSFIPENTIQDGPKVWISKEHYA
jgi:molecular chaperone GrpE (heat shock protein)